MIKITIVNVFVHNSVSKFIEEIDQNSVTKQKPNSQLVFLLVFIAFRYDKTVVLYN